MERARHLQLRGQFRFPAQQVRHSLLVPWWKPAGGILDAAQVRLQVQGAFMKYLEAQQET